MNASDQSFASAEAGFLRDLRTDTFLRRYLTRPKRMEDGIELFPNTNSPTVALGERAAAAAVFYSDSTFFSAPPLNKEQQLVYARLIHRAPCYLWRSNILSEVSQARVPSHVVGSEQLPFPAMFWTTEEAYILSPDGFRQEWAFICEYFDGRGFLIYRGGSRNGRSEIRIGSIDYGLRFPDDFKSRDDEGGFNGRYLQGAEQVLSMLAFLNSPYVEKSPMQPERGARREWLKATGKESPEVHVVKLRENSPRSEAATTNDQDRVLGRDGHWWVSAHIRAQWFPSLQAHKLIWIKQHLKGDPAKPLKERVYAVSR